MAETSNTTPATEAELHQLQGSTPPSGEAPAFEPVATAEQSPEAIEGMAALIADARKDLSAYDLAIVDNAKLLIRHCRNDAERDLRILEIHALASVLTGQGPQSLIAHGMKADAYIELLCNPGSKDSETAKRLGVSVAQDARNLAMQSVLPAAPLTLEQADGLEFTPWDMHGWEPPTRQEWAGLANPFLITAQVAYRLLLKDKAEFVDFVASMLDEEGDAFVEDQYKRLDEAEAFFGHYHNLVQTARDRYLIAAASVGHQRRDRDAVPIMGEVA